MQNKYKLKSMVELHEIESEALNQIDYLLTLDFIESLVICPDVHAGYLMPIGGVGLFNNTISPYCVGFDVGCGLCTCLIKDIFYSDIEKEKYDIFEEIKKRIPMINRSSALKYPKFESATGNKALNDKVNDKLCVQLGTLGSGNHFIELGENLNGYLSITIHSGSRNIGHSIAEYHIKVSNDCHKELPNSFLYLDSKEGKEYLQDLNFALEYALANRRTMMEIVLDILGVNKSIMSSMINENHNHALVQEDGRVLHRKGATPAELDQFGVIPGDMLAGTYITIGLGNQEYLNSASHGAGRVLSRKKAKKKFTIKEVQVQLKGIVCDIHPGMLDEAPDAYKDLDYVIKKQEGLVIKTVDYFSPKIVVKG